MENISEKTKILFLDIDGVVNCKNTSQRYRGFIGIDPYMAFLVGKITIAIPDLKIVLSSAWRGLPGSLEEITQQVAPIFDVTPDSIFDEETGRHSTRGEEIQWWLDTHPEVEKYAILDDDANMLESQLPNFFKTTWLRGVTEEIIEAVINHLK